MSFPSVTSKLSARAIRGKPDAVGKKNPLQWFEIDANTPRQVTIIKQWMQTLRAYIIAKHFVGELKDNERARQLVLRKWNGRIYDSGPILRKKSEGVETFKLTDKNECET